METVVVAAAQHRNQYYSRTKNHGTARFESFGSLPSGDLRELNCRTFQSGTGILPTPLKACTTPVTKRGAFSSSTFQKTPSPPVVSHSEDTNHLKRTVKSSSIPIPINIKIDRDNERSFSFSDDLSYSELWAGPAYSNSPPPSSLPIPKFSLRPKRTVSLELPASASIINLHPTAKSAPPSPTRERNPSPRDMFQREMFQNADCATKTLRRILNLDMADD